MGVSPTFRRDKKHRLIDVDLRQFDKSTAPGKSDTPFLLGPGFASSQPAHEPAFNTRRVQKKRDESQLSDAVRIDRISPKPMEGNGATLPRAEEQIRFHADVFAIGSGSVWRRRYKCNGHGRQPISRRHNGKMNPAMPCQVSTAPVYFDGKRTAHPRGAWQALPNESWAAIPHSRRHTIQSITFGVLTPREWKCRKIKPLRIEQWQAIADAVGGRWGLLAQS